MSTAATTPDIEFPSKAQFLFKPAPYKVMHGGRGAAKSWSIARVLLLLAAKQKLRILCTRETQTSISESVHQLLCDQIEELGLSDIYEIQQKAIICSNGSFFKFLGIRSDPGKIKGFEGVDICWVEEAEKVSERSWVFLIPTFRKAGSEIWISFNPDDENDPTSKRWMLPNAPPDAKVVEVNWIDNPWFPESLRKKKDYDYLKDPETAAHVWDGKFRKGSQAQIFGPVRLLDGTKRPKYVVEEFVAEEKNKAGELQPKAGWSGPYFGADWGFSNDPTTLVKMWMFERKLYVEYEAWGIGVELNQIPQLFDSIPGSRKHIIRADCARPETIFHVSSLGFNVVAADKWPGSVEDGIGWLRGLEQIILHQRCTHAKEEFRLYRFKTDPVTGDVLPIIIDANNHIPDSIRYGMGPAIRIPDEELNSVYEEDVSISPELDEYEMRQGF